MILNLVVLNKFYAICHFDKTLSIPQWLSKSDFYSLTRTRDELSIVCDQEVIKPSNEFLIDSDWRCIKIDSLLDLSLTGIIADIYNSLKESKIPIFTISTYNRDYFLVKNQNLGRATESLRRIGHQIRFEE